MARSRVGFIDPMLPTLVDAAPEGDAWVHEIKFDGYRTIVTRQGRIGHAYTRNGHDWTAKYGPVVEAVEALDCRSAVIDGELCVQNPDGITDFKALRRAIRSAPDKLVLFGFDLLMLDGRDLREAPLRDRRARLRDLVGEAAAGALHLSPEHVGHGPAFFRAADRHGLEGVVSKLAESRYVSGRTKAWLKIKSYTVGDYAVLGVERSATGLPVALLATLGRDPSYVGDALLPRKGTDEKQFWSIVEKLGTPRSRLGGSLAKRKASWVREGLIARVRHLRGEDKLRHAVIQSVAPRDVRDDEVDAARHPEDE